MHSFAFSLFFVSPFFLSPFLSHKTKQNKLTHTLLILCFCVWNMNVDMSLCKLHFFFCYCDNKLVLVVIMMLFVLSVWRSRNIFCFFVVVMQEEWEQAIQLFHLFLVAMMWCKVWEFELDITMSDFFGFRFFLLLFGGVCIQGGGAIAMGHNKSRLD